MVQFVLSCDNNDVRIQHFQHISFYLDPLEVGVGLAKASIEHGDPDPGASDAHLPEDVRLEERGDLSWY